MSDYSMDSRVNNETVSLTKDGFDVTVFCFRSSVFNTDEIRANVPIKRFGLIGNKVVNVSSAWVGMLACAYRTKVDCIHAHDITALPIAYLISRMKHIPLIYDSHELWIESHHSFNSKLIVKVAGYFEKVIAKKATRVITVSDSISNYLHSHFGVDNITVIRNIPSYVHSENYNLFREIYDIKSNDKIFIYQGIVDCSRGVDLIIDAAISVCYANSTCKFFILGEGPDLMKLQAIVRDSGLADRIVFVGFIDQADLLKYTRSADIGIHAIKNSCLNHEYCLPNKLFEYMHSGVVLVVTDLVELGGFVKNHEIGLTFRDGDVFALERSLLELLSNDDLFNRLKGNLSLASEQTTWSKEFLKLKEMYNQIC